MEARKSQASFQIFSPMQGLVSIRLKQSANEPKISLPKSQCHHGLFFSPNIVNNKTGIQVQKNLSDSNTDGSFTMAVSNMFLSP